MRRANKIEYWASVGNLARVSAAIREGYDVNEKAEDGYSALHAAAENGYLMIVKLLLEHGADPHAKTTIGNTPMDLAKLSKEQEVIDFLREIDKE